MYVKYIDITIILLLIIIFFTYFLYKLLFETNKLIRYRVVNYSKDNNYQIPIIKKNKKCRQLCKEKICCDYENKKSKYKKCKECESKFMCYNNLEGKCEFCLKRNNCNEFSCNGNEPINPKDNYCLLC